MRKGCRNFGTLLFWLMTKSAFKKPPGALLSSENPGNMIPGPLGFKGSLLPLTKRGLRGRPFKSKVLLKYNPYLKRRARRLRSDMTEAEQLVWSKLRRKQILGVQFYRQKPIGDYIVDFYAPKARLVVEVDGSQHLKPNYAQRDAQRDAYLAGLGLIVLRFRNSQVLKELDPVAEVIFQTVAECGAENPPIPPLRKGG